MKLTKENILSVCEKYLFIFCKNEKYGYWDNDSPRQIYAINKYGFVCYNYRYPFYFNHYLDDNYKIFISDNYHNNYASLENMDADEEVDKESLKNLIACIDNEYWVAYNQEYVNKLIKRIYKLQKENDELNIIKNEYEELKNDISDWKLEKEFSENDQRRIC